ncbi:MAG: hypothetical protein V3R56_00010 [Xanthomonadales bacterium]
MNHDECLEFRPGPITIHTDPMLRIQGYRNLDRVRPIIKETAGKMVQVFAQAIDAVVHYRQLPISECTDGLLMLEDGTVFHCDAFSRYHAASELVLVFVLTLGQGLDEAAREFGKQQQLLEQLFLETAGWLGVEAVNRQFATHIREQVVEQGYRLTRRMAPGYTFKQDGQDCSWTLEDQKPLFMLFDDTPLPVAMLENCAMLPRMSRTGLYGLVPKLSSN